MMQTKRRSTRSVLAVRAAVALCLSVFLGASGCSEQPVLEAAAATPVPQGSQERQRTEPWPQAVLDAASRIPVQENGRNKPLHTFAGFQLLRLNGKRSYKTEWGEKLEPIAWLMDTLFFPEQARHYQVLQVNDTQVVRAVGGDVAGKNRRDRFAAVELEPLHPELVRQRAKLRQKDSDDLTTLERETITLANKLDELIALLGSLNFARAEIPVGELTALGAMFPGKKEVPYLDLLPQLSALSAKLESAPDETRETYRRDVFQAVEDDWRKARYLHFMPPADRQDEDYISAADHIDALLRGNQPDPEAQKSIDQLVKLARNARDRAAFETEFVALSDRLVAQAKGRGEFGRADLEISYYKRNWLDIAQYFFVGAFVIGLALMFFPNRRVFYFGTLGLTLVGEAALVTAITIRCIIKARPPVATPYEAILLIMAVSVLVLLILERFRKDGLWMLLGTLVGSLGMLLAGWHEQVEGTDTMEPLVAVLDSNFWLATHVTTVTMGYAAGMLAALVAHIYLGARAYEVGARMLGKRVEVDRLCGDLTKGLYGILCFGVLFSTVGTILGGVWANDSWGRFWGWDPKENGALMLVLAFILVLHARMGGYLRQFGMAMASIFIGIIVMWAFWGVNLYQVGLHSYGFTEDKMFATQVYYWVEWTAFAIGVLIWGLDRAIPKPARAAA